MKTTYTLDKIRLRIVPRRPHGAPEQVEDLRAKWQRLWDLSPGGPDHCGHDDECDEYLERNDAVNDAIAKVSPRQEGQVFRSLTAYAAPGPLDGLLARLSNRRSRS